MTIVIQILYWKILLKICENMYLTNSWSDGTITMIESVKGLCLGRKLCFRAAL